MDERWVFGGLGVAGGAFMFLHGFRGERWLMGAFGLYCLLSLLRGLWVGYVDVDTRGMFERRMKRDRLETKTRDRDPGSYWYAMFGRAAGAVVFNWACWSHFLFR